MIKELEVSDAKGKSSLASLELKGYIECFKEKGYDEMNGRVSTYPAIASRKGEKAMAQPHDNWGKYYDFVYEQSYNHLYRDFTEETLEVINSILPNGTILDFGAGTGRLAIPLAHEGYQLIAVDKSIGMVNEFKRKIEGQNLGIEIHNCSISDYNNGNADLAIALFTVLNYSITEDELTKNIKNIYNHINPEGYFFFDLANRIFFNARQPLIRIEKNNLHRIVNLTNTNEQDIYTYSERCSGIYNGQEFSYEDEFKIRYWEISTLDELLRNNGFCDTNEEFPQFHTTGATYKLYKRE